MNKLCFGSTLLAFCLFMACKNDTSNGVQEIRPGDNSNAAIIRNPVSAEGPQDTSTLAKIKFENVEFDFGTVKEGVIIEHVFKFTNVGKAPLVIQDARSSCGCTTPEWSKDPIPVGGQGEILARFNTEGKTEGQHKTITVQTNTFPSETKISLQGTVTPRKK